MRFNSKTVPTTDNNYNYHIKAVALFNQSYGVHIMLLVINSLRGRQTHTCIHPHRNNFKNQARANRRTAHAWLKIELLFCSVNWWLMLP